MFEYVARNMGLIDSSDKTAETVKTVLQAQKDPFTFTYANFRVQRSNLTQKQCVTCGMRSLVSIKNLKFNPMNDE